MCIWLYFLRACLHSCPYSCMCVYLCVLGITVRCRQSEQAKCMLRVNSITYFDMNIHVLCTHLHDIAKVCAIDDASIIKNALVESIFISTHYAYIWFLLFAFIHAFEVMQLSCVHLALLLACLSAFLSVFLLVCFAAIFREQFLDLKAGCFFHCRACQ